MKVRYIGDGKRFIRGYPANPLVELEVEEEEGEKLLARGLYEKVEEEVDIDLKEDINEDMQENIRGDTSFKSGFFNQDKGGES